MAIDVTDRRRLEQELRSARAIEAVGRLAGGIAHDFNNQVMAINGFAELLIDHLPEGSDEHDAAVQIRTAGLRAAALTSQLLAFARPHDARPTRFDLNELVAGLGETLLGLSGPNVRVRIAATATRAMVVADRDHVARAIVGCVLNARDAMPDGGELRVETSDVDPTLAVQVTGGADEVCYVGLAISDNGPTGAFPTENGDVANRTGLGLALVYSTVQMAGGRIRLESLPGHGSTVRILLPIASGDGHLPGAIDDVGGGAVPENGLGLEAWPASGALGAAETRDAPVGRVAGGDAPLIVGSALIAVVEDEPGVRSLVERLLVRGGHRVLTFPDGAAALDALTDPDVSIDLLITDLVMPGPNGIEVARQVRRDRPGLPVLLMSGYASDALRTERLSESNLELLEKPFSGADLLDRVAAVLGSAADARR